MILNLRKLLTQLIVIFLFSSFNANSNTIKKIEIVGNNRISDETILMFANLSTNQEIENLDLNDLIKDLYKTNFFKNISASFKDKTLLIKVEENPVINDIEFRGIKAKKYINNFKNKTFLKSRSPYTDYLLEKDKNIVLSELKEMGFYFPKVDVLINKIDNDIYDIIYDIDLGSKARIEKISFNGNKIFKDSKLKSIIISEEHKPWKFISGKKYLNENLLDLDKRLLKNYYLNNGYYKTKINSSFAKLIENNNFEIIFNIDADQKYYFNNLELKLPEDFDKKNYESIYKLFNNLKGKPYSFNSIEKILNSIDKISTNEQFESTKSSVMENIVENKINLNFIIEETKKTYVDKINIVNNNVTRENVIRNQLELVEGDLFNEILLTKSINNIKSLNFFKKVNHKINNGKEPNSKIITINVEEKPTGEIMAGAGVGTSGGTLSFGIKENNYLGKGLNVQANATLNEDSIKGMFAVTNPNFQNSDKSVSLSIQSNEINRLTDFGYKTNKTGFSIFTNFEYLDDFKLGVGANSFYEKIETNSTASAMQKKQEGNYFDNFLNLDFDFDKRNQKFQTSDGFRSFYSIDLPVVSETNTVLNTYTFNNYSEFFEKNIFKTSLYLKSASSLSGDDIKLSERLYIPSSKLRGFEYGKIGPKDGKDYIGGNFAGSINFSSTLPQIFQNSQSTDFIIFMDIGSVWGVDYDSTLPRSNKIRSSFGIALDWFSAIGPLNFTLAQPITKNDTDITESFRFNLGTTF